MPACSHKVVAEALIAATLPAGYNGYGQLGDNSTVDRLYPMQVSGNASWTGLPSHSYAATLGFTCGIQTNASLWCWVSARRGAARRGRQLEACPEDGLSAAAGAAITFVHHIPQGNNAQGQLGDNSITNRRVPVQVTGYRTWAQVELGDAYACGVTTARQILCWVRGGRGRGYF